MLSILIIAAPTFYPNNGARFMIVILFLIITILAHKIIITSYFCSLLKGKTDTVVIPSLKPAPTGEGLNSSIPGIGVKLQPVRRLKTLV